jgi:hypothetical protein
MTLYGSRILISNQKVVQILKKKNLIPFWVNDDFPLPRDPDNILILVHKHHSDSISSLDLERSQNQQEKKMNYYAMAQAVKTGCHARRPNWKPEEKVWSNGKILIHNTPYFGEPFNQSIQGYPYVCEQEDVEAYDWELVAV